jgi:hypothetical protein
MQREHVVDVGRTHLWIQPEREQALEHRVRDGKTVSTQQVCPAKRTRRMASVRGEILDPG